MFRRPASIIEIITSVCNQWLGFPLVWVLPAQFRLSLPCSQLRLSGSNLIPSFASCFLLEAPSLTDWLKRRSAAESGCYSFDRAALSLNNGTDGFDRCELLHQLRDAK